VRALCVAVQITTLFEFSSPLRLIWFTLVSLATDRSFQEATTMILGLDHLTRLLGSIEADRLVILCGAGLSVLHLAI